MQKKLGERWCRKVDGEVCKGWKGVEVMARCGYGSEALVNLGDGRGYKKEAKGGCI